MQFLSAEHYTPVLLQITKVNEEEGTGTCINTYVGFMSNARIYAKLVTATPPQNSCDFPEYIRVRKGKTTGFENYVELIATDYKVESVSIKELAYHEGRLSNYKGIKEFSSEDPAAIIIQKLWTTELINQVLDRNFMTRAA